jgi:pSer/pThr/pTyr-binding forkhead associated (FHA) protein
MTAFLEAVSGPITGRKIEVRAGSILRVGRTAKSDYAIAEDPYLSGAHFSVECDGREVRVRDLGSSNGTFLNGERISEGIVREGDSVAAGATTFAVKIEIAAAAATLDTGRMPTAKTAVTTPYAGGQTAFDMTSVMGRTPAAGVWPGFSHAQSMLLSALYSLGEPVFAVLDAAKDSRIPAFLDASGETYAPLHEGPEGRRSSSFLVLIPPHARLLDVLIKDGWGRGWGFFLCSHMPFDAVYAHLRTFLHVRTAAGRPLTLPFYDPRILRALLPSMAAQECTEFFGPLTRIVVEGEKPEVALEFRDSQRGARQQALVLV